MTRILCADAQNLADVRALDPGGCHRDKLGLITSFCQRHSATEVPDPYYGEAEGFEQVITLIEDAADGLLAALRPLPPD